MAKIKSYSNMSNLSELADFQRFVSNLLDDIFQVVNGQLDFQENIRSSLLQTLTFANSSEIKTVPHNLGFVPRGTLVIKQTAAASIYAPQGVQYSWTNTTIFLQSSAAVTASLYII